MLTGALLLPKTNKFWDFISRRFSRIIWPFLFWSLIYISIGIYRDCASDSFLEIISYILINLRDGASYHLWYVYMIMGLYLLIPIMSKWIQHRPTSHIKIYLIIWFVVMFFIISFLKTMLRHSIICNCQDIWVTQS